MDNELTAKYVAILDFHGRGDIARRNVEILKRSNSGETFTSIGLGLGISPSHASVVARCTARAISRAGREGLQIGTPLAKDDNLLRRAELSSQTRGALRCLYGDVVTVEKFCSTPLADLHEARDLGKRSVRAVVEFVESHGFERTAKDAPKAYGITSLRQVQTIVSNLGYRVVDSKGRVVNLEGLVRN